MALGTHTSPKMINIRQLRFMAALQEVGAQVSNLQVGNHIVRNQTAQIFGAHTRLIEEESSQSRDEQESEGGMNEEQ